MKSIEEIFSDLAALSRGASGWCTHNPNVSAIIYDRFGNLAATGIHKKKISNDHAEVVAIKAAGERALGGTLYVSLEPCNHSGTTGPCTQVIKDSGIAKVVYGVSDPNPVASGGADALRSSGVEVIQQKSPLLEFEQRAWLHRIAHGRPLITAKIAITVDGRIAAVDGTSKWITSEESRHDVQLLRSQAQAIITSTATYLADSPSLLPRIQGAPTPLRVVMGKRSVNAPGLNVINSREFTELLELLNKEGVNHALVEAGGTFISALLRADLIDELIIYQAPKILGSGTSWVEDLGITTLSDAIALETLSVAPIGADIKTHYRIVRS